MNLTFKDRLRMLLQFRGYKYCGSTGEGLMKIWLDGGVKSLFRGNMMAIARIFPEYAVFCVIYEACRDYMAMRSHRRVAELSKAEVFGCGVLGGMVALSAIYPLELIRTRFTLG